MKPCKGKNSYRAISKTNVKTIYTLLKLNMVYAMLYANTPGNQE